MATVQELADHALELARQSIAVNCDLLLAVAGDEVNTLGNAAQLILLTNWREAAIDRPTEQVAFAFLAAAFLAAKEVQKQ